jgi:hypothetical protein
LRIPLLILAISVLIYVILALSTAPIASPAGMEEAIPTFITTSVNVLMAFMRTLHQIFVSYALISAIPAKTALIA